MKVVFAQRFWRELLGPACLSSCLRRAGHTTSAVIRQSVPALRDAVLQERPGLVALYWCSDDHVFLSALVRALKQVRPDLPVIAGGPHPTHAPQMVETVPLDAVCRSEGEDALVEYVAALEGGGDGRDVRNLWVRTGGVRSGGAIVRNEVRPRRRDLDAWPDPDRDLYARYRLLATNPHRSVMAGRGCPYPCSFCFTPLVRELHGKDGATLRWRSPERVLGELRDLRDRHGIRSVRFEDDTFSMDRRWLFPFLERYEREVALPFICYVRADQVDDELARRLRRAGCGTVCFGVETGDERVRLELLKKGIRDEHLRTAASVLHRNGVRFYTTNMLGLPGEDLAGSWQTVHLNQELRPDEVWCSIYQPYPGLPLTDRAIELGLLTREQAEEVGTRPYYGNTFDTPDKRAIFNLHKLFLVAVKFPALEPLIRTWIHLPAEHLNRVVAMASSAWSYRAHTHVTPQRVLWEGLHLARFFWSAKAM